MTTSDARIKQLHLIGLICFYGGTVEVFFSYDHQTSKWLFCFDGNIVVSADWNAVRRKCIDFHLQPFLLIYANADRDPVDISQLLKRTVIQTENTNGKERKTLNSYLYMHIYYSVSLLMYYIISSAGCSVYTITIVGLAW